jgi:hypothetical protein
VHGLRKNAAHLVEKPSIALVPRLKTAAGVGKLPPYALLARRTRRKLKKLLPARQFTFAQKRKPTIRRFITARMLFSNVLRPRLLSVRAANHTQPAADSLISGVSFDKEVGSLYQRHALLTTTNAYAQLEKNKLRAKRLSARESFDNSRTKFIQR